MRVAVAELPTHRRARRVTIAGMAAAILLLGAISFALLGQALPRPRRGWRRHQLEGLAVFLLVAALAAAPDALFLSKWAGRLAMPVGVFWLALLVASGWALGAQRRRLAAALLVLTVGYTLAGNENLGSSLVAGLEAPFRAQPVVDEPYDAVIVLGGGTTLRPWGEPQVSSSGDRLVTAARWYRRGAVRRLVCTGSSVAGLDQREGRNLAAEARQVLVELGVPPEAIVELPGPRNTREELAAVATAARAEGWGRLGLLTSAWHLPRAMRHAEASGLRFDPIAADFRGRPPVVTMVSVVPVANGFELTHLAAWEHLGAWVGR